MACQRLPNTCRDLPRHSCAAKTALAHRIGCLAHEVMGVWPQYEHRVSHLDRPTVGGSRPSLMSYTSTQRAGRSWLMYALVPPRPAAGPWLAAARGRMSAPLRRRCRGRERGTARRWSLLHRCRGPQELPGSRSPPQRAAGRLALPATKPRCVHSGAANCAQVWTGFESSVHSGP